MSAILSFNLEADRQVRRGVVGVQDHIVIRVRRLSIASERIVG